MEFQELWAAIVELQRLDDEIESISFGKRFSRSGFTAECAENAETKNGLHTATKPPGYVV